MAFASHIAQRVCGQGIGGSVSGEVDPALALKGYRALLGGSLKELFHCRYDLVPASSIVASWKGQIAGWVATPVAGEPADYIARSHIFSGRATCATGNGPARRLATPVAAALLPASAPSAYMVSAFARTQRLTGTEQALITLNRSGGVPVIEFRDTSTDASTIGVQLQNASAYRIQLPLTDLAPHIIEGWFTGSVVSLRMDGGAVQTVAGPGTLEADAVSAVIGGLVGGFGRRGDFEHGLHLICDAYPGAAVARALRDFIHYDLAF